MREMGRAAKAPDADGAPIPAMRRFVPISYRVDHAAELIGLSSAKVWALIAEGAIRAKKLGGATVVMHDVLHAYVAEAPDWVSPRVEKAATRRDPLGSGHEP